jgi:hypothetical protein
MKYNTFTYSLKVWLTSVVAAPLLSVIIMYLKLIPGSADGFDFIYSGPELYLVFTAFGFLFSFATWVAFWIITKAATLYVSQPVLMRWLIFAAGILLTTATFCIVFPHDLFQVNSVFRILMVCNCACIGGGVWFYKLKPTAVSE